MASTPIMLRAAGPVGLAAFCAATGLGIEAADVADRRGGQPEQHDQRDEGQVSRDFGDVLNALEAHEGGQAPQTTMRIVGIDVEHRAQRERREINVHAHPAELQDAHEEAGHDKTALRAKGRGADNVERQAGLHAEQARHEIEQEMAHEGRDHKADQRPANPCDSVPPGAPALAASCQNTNHRKMPA